MKPALVPLGVLGLAGLVAGWNFVALEELQKTLDESDFALVAFVAPEETKSRALETEWDLVASQAQNAVISVDCPANPALCTANRIEDYPTVRVVERGGVATHTYLGPRRAGAILHYLNRLKRPVVSEITPDSLADFKVVDETVLIGYILASDAEARKAFEEVAQAHHTEFTFGIVSDAGAIEAQNLQSPAVVCYRPLDRESKALAPFDNSASTLATLVLAASRPVIGELTPANHARFLARAWPMIYLFGATEPERAELRLKLAAVAAGYYDSLTAVTVDPAYFPDLPGRLGLAAGEFPAGAVHQLSQDRVYPYPRGRPIDAKAIQGWGLNVFQGKVRPWTPPGVTATQEEDRGPTKVAKRVVSMHPYIRVAGRDEL